MKTSSPPSSLPSSSSSVDALRADRTGRRTKDKDDDFDCRRCITRHGRKSWPAYIRICSKCSLSGHFSSMCRVSKPKVPEQDVKSKSRKVNAVQPSEESESDSDYEVYVNTIHTTKTIKDEWSETLVVGRCLLKVKLDTGAQFNVVSRLISEKLGIILQPSKTKRLISYSEHPIAVIGEINTKCKVKGKSKTVDVTFKVVNEDLTPILGKTSCQEMGLVACIHHISSKETARREKLFEGLGCLRNFDYDIDLKENPEFQICPPRRIAYSMR